MRRLLLPSAAALALLLSSCVAAPNLEQTLSGASHIAQTTRVLARDGSVIAELHAEIDRQVVPLGSVARSLRDAVIAIEDARFYEHGGIDYAGIVRAFVKDAAQGKAAEGGSTITQQLVKNTLITPQHSLRRKIREAVLAIELEKRMSKDQILERYLNTVYFGHGAYGVQAAARAYFQQDASRLSLPRSALLAGIIRAPSEFDPSADPVAALKRRNVVLGRMRDLHMLTAAQFEAARGAPLGLDPPEDRDHYLAPYFVDHVKDLIFDGNGFGALGATRAERINAMFKGGLRIQTTLDLRMQDAAEQAARRTLPFKRDPYAAFVAVDPKDGGILAMVGGRDFFDPKDPFAKFNLAVRSKRQPGSAFKPFTLIAALERGIPLSRRYRAGSNIALTLPGGGVWNVHNYEGGSFGSRLSLAQATALSVNVVYAQVALQVGPEHVEEVARRMGITSPLHAYPSIALGAQEVNPLEMASAYAGIANGGYRVPPVAIERITDANGAVLYQAKSTRTRVLSPAVAIQTTEALEGVMRTGTGRLLQTGFPVAGKTGTSEEYHDAWFAGFSPRVAAVAWVGFPRAQISMRPPRTRIRVYGSSWPGQIWRQFMLEVHKGLPALDFARAADLLVHLPVDVLRGCRPNPFTPSFMIVDRTFVRGTEPTGVCTWPRSSVVDRVASVLGMDPARARRALLEQGIDASTERRYCPSFSPGMVCEQTPAPGASVPVGARAVLGVSDDSAVDAVPMVLGDREAAARGALSGGGFQIAVVRARNSEQYSGCRDASVSAGGHVWAQNPCAGARYGRGSTVTIYLN